MRTENCRDEVEPRDPPRVAEEERPGADSGDESGAVEGNWSASGTEDPAFFIKPSDGG